MVEDLDVLWERYGKLQLADIPADAQLGGIQCILDWVGCALIGSREPLAEILLAELATKDDDATVIGTMERSSTHSAARINGGAGHALDFDDTNLTARYHATCSVLPAILALGETNGASGADLLTSYIVGVEICSRLRMAIGVRHYHEQWHQTATMGIFGAVAAAGWMLGLDAEEFRNAIGFAASNACGVHANFGTMTKPSHAGQAAEAGLLAAGLAKRGFTGNARAFEAFSKQAAGDIDWAPVHEAVDTWIVKDTLFKRYSSGAGTQATIEGAKRLNLRPEDVIHAEVRVPVPVLDSGYGVRWPKVGLEAKFSLPGCMALTTLGFDLGDPASFDDANVQSPEFVDLIQRIELVGDPTYTEWMASLVVETPDGTKVEDVMSNRDSGPVESRNVFLRQKFDTLSTPIIGANAKPLGDMLMELASVDRVTQLTELMVAG